ncbi:MAG: hypothetical protein ISR96_11445 [Nitrospira sp.]|nr:hypothetical protein [bacterium]MBL7050119.1 hypothetical protein [Nitrospira sp.]
MNKILSVLAAAVMILSSSLLYAQDYEQPAPEKVFKGTLKSTKPAGNYTYLQLDIEGKDQWVATMTKSLNPKMLVGDTIEFNNALLMKGFESSTSGDVFETILLVPQVTVLGKDMAAMPQDDTHAKIQAKAPAQAASEPKSGEIKKAKSGKTISEIYENAEALKGLEVTVRGRVMKVNKNILKNNWIMIMDGSGSAPEDNIFVVTKELVDIGDEFTVTGKVNTNVSLGGGYDYRVLIEDGSFTK